MEDPEGGGGGGGINPISQPKFCPNPFPSLIFGQIPVPEKLLKFRFEIKPLVVLFIEVVG